MACLPVAIKIFYDHNSCVYNPAPAGFFFASTQFGFYDKNPHFSLFIGNSSLIFVLGSILSHHPPSHEVFPVISLYNPTNLVAKSDGTY